MLTLPLCNVVFQDDIKPVIESTGLVVVSGESPNATVRISKPDYDNKRFTTVDRLTRAAFTRKGGTWTFKGRSEYLATEVGAADSLVTILVTPEPGCDDCK